MSEPGSDLRGHRRSKQSSGQCGSGGTRGQDERQPGHPRGGGAVPLHRDVCGRDRAALAGPLGGRAHVRGAQPCRPAGDRLGRPAAQAVRAGHVPLPLRGRPARRPPARVHRHRRLRPVPAHVRLQRAARAGLRLLRPARRAVRGADRPAPAGHHRRERRQHAPPAAPARPGPRPAARGRDDGRRLLPLDPVDLPAGLQLLVRHRDRPGPANRRAGGRVHGRDAPHTGRAGLV